MNQSIKEEEETIHVWTGSEYVKKKRPVKRRVKKVIERIERWKIALITSAVIITVLVIIVLLIQ